MSGHTHHEHSGSDLSAAAEQALIRAGEQWTDLRADVFAALATHASPASAYDIADEVSAKRG
jgi:Fur family transcriptional regulator, zinc uptake regulator